MRSSAVWAIVVNNFAFHYAFYLVMNWLPTYFNRCVHCSCLGCGCWLDARHTDKRCQLPAQQQGPLGVAISLPASVVCSECCAAMQAVTQASHVHHAPGLGVCPALCWVLPLAACPQGVFVIVLRRSALTPPPTLADMPTAAAANAAAASAAALLCLVAQCAAG